MEGQEFGPLVKRAAKAKGLSQGRLGYLLTDDDGPFIDSSRVRLLYEGKWRLTHATVERLIGILAPHLDPAEAWASSGLLPPGTTAAQLRKLDLVAAAASRVSPEELAQVLTLPSDLDDELVRRLRPPLELVTRDPGRGHASGQYGPVGPTASLDPGRRIRPTGRPHVTPRLIGGDPGFSARSHTPEPTAYPALHERRRRDRRHPRPAPVLPGATPDQRRLRRLEVAA